VHERSRGAAGTKEIYDYVERLRVQKRWSLEIFARGGSAGEDENARADDGANAKSGSSASEISLSIDLQQRSWLSEVRIVSLAGGSVVGCDKGFWVLR
jgi:hypothetical protein